MPEPPRTLATIPESPGRRAFHFLLLLVGLFLIAGPLIRLSEWSVSPFNNGWLEANAWDSGRLDLPLDAPTPDTRRVNDTAWFGGKLYNVFPPLWSFISYAVIALTRLQSAWGGLPAQEANVFYPPWYVGLAALPLPAVGYWAFCRSSGRGDWAAVLTAYWILGTPLFALLCTSRNGYAYCINHLLSNIGLMLIAGDLCGRRRIWPAAIGFIIAAWSRQLTILYLPALFAAAWSLPRPRRAKLTLVAVTALFACGTLAILNYLRFGNPLDSGYAYLYDGRSDIYAQRFREHSAVFHIAYAPRNLYYMNMALPDVWISRMRLLVSSHPDGVSIWLTSPLLMAVLLLARHWWRDPTRRNLMLCSAAVIGALLCYHTTGGEQYGMYRFAMDFVPIWLVVAAPSLVTGRSRWFTLACLAWSALYFHLLSGTLVT